MGLTEMLIASLADAIDVTRHYFIAATILDLELLIMLMLLLSSRAAMEKVWVWTYLKYRFHPKAPQQQELRKIVRGEQAYQAASILHQRASAASH
jgi:hypothetical protein